MSCLRPGIEDGIRHKRRVAHDDHGLDLLDAQGPRERRPLHFRKQWSTLVALSGGAGNIGRCATGEGLGLGVLGVWLLARDKRPASSPLGGLAGKRFSDTGRRISCGCESLLSLGSAVNLCIKATVLSSAGMLYTYVPIRQGHGQPRQATQASPWERFSKILTHSVKPATRRFPAEHRARTAQPFRRTRGSATPLPPLLPNRQTHLPSLHCQFPPPRGHTQRHSCRDPRVPTVGPTAAAGSRRRPLDNGEHASLKHREQLEVGGVVWQGSKNRRRTKNGFSTLCPGRNIRSSSLL